MLQLQNTQFTQQLHQLKESNRGQPLFDKILNEIEEDKQKQEDQIEQNISQEPEQSFHIQTQQRFNYDIYNQSLQNRRLNAFYQEPYLSTIIKIDIQNCKINDKQLTSNNTVEFNSALYQLAFAMQEIERKVQIDSIVHTSVLYPSVKVQNNLLLLRQKKMSFLQTFKVLRTHEEQTLQQQIGYSLTSIFGELLQIIKNNNFVLKYDYQILIPAWALNIKSQQEVSQQSADYQQRNINILSSFECRFTQQDFCTIMYTNESFSFQESQKSKNIFQTIFYELYTFDPHLMEKETKSCLDTIFPVPVNIQRVVKVICGVVNIIVPGVGTFILSLVSEPINITMIVFAIIQFFFCWLVIPWIWSIIHGIRMIVEGVITDPHKEDQTEEQVQTANQNEEQVQVKSNVSIHE